MRDYKRQIAATVVLGVLSALAFAGLSLADAGPIEPVGISSWNPSSVTINSGEKVKFKNPSATAHGVTWTGTSPSSCTSAVVNGGSGTGWEGECTFNQGGSFPFRCTIHPAMTGTVTVNGGPEEPSVTTGTATVGGETSATLTGTVNPHGESTEYFFEYGKTTAYGTKTTNKSAGSGTSNVSASQEISGLEPETTYHYKLFAENATGPSAGTDQTFRTAGPATATTEPATGVGSVEATLVGKVNPNGQPNAKYFFNWGTEAGSYTHTTPEKAITGSTLATKTELVTGLTPETTYHFQVVVKYGATEVEGLDKEFTTLNLPPPLATTGAATGISSTGATVEGSVNPQGVQTTYYFNYGLTSSYGAKTAELSAGKGSAALAVSAALAGLLPETTYHYQLVALSAGGTTPGADQTFTTLSNIVVTPPMEEVTPPPPPPVETAPPDTKIAPKPPAKTHDRTPTIKFRASVGGASFQCSVDSKPFKACRSPFTAPSLKPGRHRIRVKAVVGGVADPTPAAVSFKVLAKKR